jgi:hypothetical protein
MPKITVQSEGVTISEKRTVNLVAGENVTITPTNNSGHGALDIEISASGGAAATIPSFESFTTNITTPATSGTSVAAGALAHNKNTTYTELISSLGFDAYWVEILVGNVFTNATDTGLLLDIATGTAGNETVIIPNLNCGHAAAWSTSGMGGQRYAFPLFIPSGSRISATAQAVVGGDTVDVGIWLYGGATAPDFIGTSVTAYGVDLASSQGTVITAGNGSEGAWGQITAATSATHHFFSAGLAGVDNALSGTALILDVGTGPATETAISTNHWYGAAATEFITQASPVLIWSTVASGTRLVARAQDAAGITYDVVLYGVTLEAP